MNVEGSCHCGQITFEARIDPGAVRICHCIDCQTLTGSAYRVTVQAEPDSFVLRSGSPKTYIKIAASGNKRLQAFCPECGTPIYSADANGRRAFGIRVGTLRQRTQLQPARQIWYRSALPWIADIAGIPHVDRQ